MSRALRLAVLGLTALAGSAAAQVRQEPQLILSIGGGLTGSRSEAWSLPGHELLVTASAGTDTVALARRFRPGLVATLAATYHPSEHLGYTAEAGYFGIATEMRCAPVGGFRADPENKNEQACTSAQGTHVETSVVGFQLGMAYRFAWGQRLTPYARASAGLGFLANSFVRTEGAINAPGTCGSSSPVCLWTLLDEQEPATMTWIASLAAGTSMRVGTGYRVRLEVRDLIGSLPVPAGVADPLTGFTGTTTAVRHTLVVTAALDVVLERRRGRRY